MPSPTADRPKEACGVFGVHLTAPGSGSVAHMTYDGLYALQHRGQESAGMATTDGDAVMVVKDMGLVTNVFNEYKLAGLQGHLAIGHTRYSTTGTSTRGTNAQPVYRVTHPNPERHGPVEFALGHNGNLTNTTQLAAQAGHAARARSAATVTSSVSCSSATSTRIPATGWRMPWSGCCRRWPALFPWS